MWLTGTFAGPETPFSGRKRLSEMAVSSEQAVKTSNVYDSLLFADSLNDSRPIKDTNPSLCPGAHAPGFKQV